MEPTDLTLPDDPSHALSPQHFETLIWSEFYAALLVVGRRWKHDADWITRAMHHAISSGRYASEGHFETVEAFIEAVAGTSKVTFYRHVKALGLPPPVLVQSLQPAVQARNIPRFRNAENVTERSTSPTPLLATTQGVQAAMPVPMPTTHPHPPRQTGPGGSSPSPRTWTPTPGCQPCEALWQTVEAHDNVVHDGPTPRRFIDTTAERASTEPVYERGDEVDLQSEAPKAMPRAVSGGVAGLPTWRPGERDAGPIPKPGAKRRETAGRAS